MLRSSRGPFPTCQLIASEYRSGQHEEIELPAFYSLIMASLEYLSLWLQLPELNTVPAFEYLNDVSHLGSGMMTTSEIEYIHYLDKVSKPADLVPPPVIIYLCCRVYRQLGTLSGHISC